MGKTSKILVWAFLSFVFLFSNIASSHGKDIKVGFVSCLTGSAAFYGTYMKEVWIWRSKR